MDPESVLRLKEEVRRLKEEAIRLKEEAIELTLKLEAVDAVEAQESHSGTGSASLEGIVASREDSMVVEQPASVEALTTGQREENFRNNCFPKWGKHHGHMPRDILAKSGMPRDLVAKPDVLRAIVEKFVVNDQLIVDVRSNLSNDLKLWYDAWGGGTLLHWAVRMDDLRLVIRILEATQVDVNAKDELWEATALHWAVRIGNLAIVKAMCTYQLASGMFNLRLEDKWGFNALEYALFHGEPNISMVKELLKFKDSLYGYADKMDVMKEVEEILQEDGSGTMIKSQRESWYAKLERGGSYLHWAVKMEDVALVAHILQDLKIVEKDLIDCGRYGKLSPLSYAVRLGNLDIVKLMVSKYIESRNGIVNHVDLPTGYTALHWAIVTGWIENIDMVNELLRCEATMTLTIECKHGKSPLQLAYHRGFKNIERALMKREAVRRYIDNLYRDRQVYVDAANSILVGAALIASVTFASWLQPPLGYTSDYANVQEDVRLRAFWVFNYLSFYFGIATVVFGAHCMLPRSGYFIKESVDKLRKDLMRTAISLACSVIFVIIAFGIVVYIVLIPIMKFHMCMIVPAIFGGLWCLYSLWLLSYSMWEDTFGRNLVRARRQEWLGFGHGMYDE